MYGIASRRVIGPLLALCALVGAPAALAQGSIGLAPKPPRPAPAAPSAQVAPTPVPAPAAATAQAALDAARIAWEAMPLADRVDVQTGLVWTGDYTGALDGTFGRMTFEALTAFQVRHKITPDGMSSPAFRAALEEVAKKKREAVGWQMVADPATGSRIGLPTRLVGAARKIDGGTQWTTKDGRIDIRTFAVAGQDLPRLFEQMKAVAPGRRITYSVLRPDWFVVADTGAGRDGYARFARVGDGARGFVFVHDPALGPEFARIVIATAGTFEPVAGAAPVVSSPAAPSGQSVPPVTPGGPTPPVTPPAPPMAAATLAATGLTVAPGKILTAGLGDCRAPIVAGRPATIAKADVGSGLALLETTPGAGLPPLALAEAAPTAGSAVTLAVAGPSLSAAAGSVNERGVRAALQRGGLGAPILDASGRLAGLVTARPDEKRQIMGLVPETTYAFADPAALARAIEAAGGTVDKSPAGPAVSSGAAIAGLAPRIVAITCGK